MTTQPRCAPKESTLSAKGLTIASVAAALLLMAGCDGGNRSGADSTAVVAARQVVERRMTDFVTLLRKNQFADSVASFHSQDFQSYESQMVVPSQTALVAMFGDVAKTMKVDSFVVTTREMFVHDNGAVVYQLGSYHEGLSYRDGKTPSASADNNFVIRWVKEPDGVWRMSRFFSTPAPVSSKK